MEKGARWVLRKKFIQRLINPISRTFSPSTAVQKDAKKKPPPSPPLYPGLTGSEYFFSGVPLLPSRVSHLGALGTRIQHPTLEHDD